MGTITNTSTADDAMAELKRERGQVVAPKTTMVYCPPCMRHWKAPAREDYWKARVELCPDHQSATQGRRRTTMSTYRSFRAEQDYSDALVDLENALNVPLEHPSLRSLSECKRICSGWNVDNGCVNGGDEPDENEEICSACVRAEDDFYRARAQERDRREIIDSGSQYRYLKEERNEELRAIQNRNSFLRW